mgnify:CR=1 FL=1
MIHCGMKYQAGYMDYKLFEMYDLNDKQRKTIVTRGINNSIVKKYNNPEYMKYFHEKPLFNKKFNKYLLRDWLQLDGTEENFEAQQPTSLSRCRVQNTLVVLWAILKI